MCRNNIEAKKKSGRRGNGDNLWAFSLSVTSLQVWREETRLFFALLHFGAKRRKRAFNQNPRARRPSAACFISLLNATTTTTTVTTFASDQCPPSMSLCLFKKAFSTPASILPPHLLLLLPSSVFHRRRRGILHRRRKDTLTNKNPTAIKRALAKVGVSHLLQLSCCSSV